MTVEIDGGSSGGSWICLVLEIVCRDSGMSLIRGRFSGS